MQHEGTTAVLYHKLNSDVKSQDYYRVVTTEYSMVIFREDSKAEDRQRTDLLELSFAVALSVATIIVTFSKTTHLSRQIKSKWYRKKLRRRPLVYSTLRMDNDTNIDDGDGDGDDDDDDDDDDDYYDDDDVVVCKYSKRHEQSAITTITTATRLYTGYITVFI
uniref:Uncharacterized protein n=1 Tax=Glossina pallidipes TaxID=7398 RepID=A0A1A9ZWP2_GLOPL